MILTRVPPPPNLTTVRKKTGGPRSVSRRLLLFGPVASTKKLEEHQCTGYHTIVALEMPLRHSLLPQFSSRVLNPPQIGFKIPEKDTRGLADEAQVQR